MANNLLMLIKLDSDTMAFLSLLVSIVGAVAAIFAAFYSNVAVFYAKKAATKRDLTRVGQDTQHIEHVSSKPLSIDTPIQTQEQQEASQVQEQQEASQVQEQQEASQAQEKPETSQAQEKQETTQPQEKQEAIQPQVKQEASQAQEKQEAAQPKEKQETAQVQKKQETAQPQVKQEASQAQAQHISISVEGGAMGEVPLELFLTLQDPSIRVSRVKTLGEAGKTLGSSPCKATDKAQVFKSILAPDKVRQWWAEGESTGEGESRSVLRVYLLLDQRGKEVYRDMPVSIVEGLTSVGIASLVVWTIKGSI